MKRSTILVILASLLLLLAIALLADQFSQQPTVSRPEITGTTPDSTAPTSGPTDPSDPAPSDPTDPTDPTEDSQPSDDPDPPGPYIPAPIPDRDADAAIPGLTAKQALVYDVSENQYLYVYGNKNQRIRPASLTKLFSSYIVLQYLDENEVIETGREILDLHPDFSKAGLQVGDTMTVYYYIQAMLLPSGNDAAYVMAVNVGRRLLDDPDASIQAAKAAFVSEMNRQAQVLGMTGSHFANPFGVDDPDHYTTAADMLTIARVVMENPVIRTHAATARATLRTLNGNVYELENSNKLIHPDSGYYHPNNIGLKTGRTTMAGSCLIGLFQKDDGSYIITCVFGCPGYYDRYTDSSLLFDTFGK